MLFSERRFLVRLLAEESNFDDKRSRGLSVRTQEMTDAAGAQSRFLIVECRDGGGHELFDLLGVELATRLATGVEAAPDVIARVLAKWRRFWGQIPKQLLSREEQLGLFAELWFLSNWLLPRVGTGEAVTRWRGPFGARHDFEWTARSIEVKATTSIRGRIHRINGLDQLCPPEQGDLLFFSLRLHEEAGATHTLPLLVASCRTQLGHDIDAISRFDSALAQTGYSPAHEEEYEKLKVRVVEEGLFAVRDDFPRLTPAQISGGVPAGIERVECEINLGGHMNLCIARTSAEATGL